jgi:predicted AlkP superfamily phosphohydrolase/phosphomutase
VFDFLSFDGYDWDVVNRTQVREHALWELLDRHDLRSVVVNVPVTHPPRPFDGALTPGYVAPESPPGHPEGILEDVRSDTGDYLVYSPAPRRAPPDERVEEFVTLTRMRGRAFRYLADRFDPDFGFLQFQQTDTVFHEFPEADWAVRSVYEAVDHEINDIIDQCQPDTIIIASDHGIEEYGGYEFRVNEALHDEGFVETTVGGEGMPSWSSIARNKLRREETTPSQPLVPRLLSGGVSLAASVGLTSQRIEQVLDRLGLASVAAAVPSESSRTARVFGPTPQKSSSRIPVATSGPS